MASNKRRPVIGNLLSNGGHNRSSPLKILSPTGIINSDLAVVGLAIVAALQNTTTTTTSSLLNQPPKHHHHHHHNPSNLFYDDESESESESERKGSREMCVFDISPITVVAVVDHHIKGKCYPPPDFLTCCHLCNKKLHGKDIYMYRGEKAFCSIECRSRKMRMDENHCNKITQVVSGSSQSQSQSHAHVLSTGIFAL